MAGEVGDLFFLIVAISEKVICFIAGLIVVEPLGMQRCDASVVLLKYMNCSVHLRVDQADKLVIARIREGDGERCAAAYRIAGDTVCSGVGLRSGEGSASDG